MYADQATEQKLVGAIKEAAKRIDYSTTDDPEAILAECLIKQGLDEGFAKTAATALNKSYSVYYMSTHDDDTRGDDHKLLDSDKVAAHMTKEDTPVCPHTGEKTEEEPEVKVKRITTVKKEAAARKSDPDSARQFKSYSDYVDWLQSSLDKVASSQQEAASDIAIALERIYNLHKEAKEYDFDDYTVQCIYRQGNPDMNFMLDSLGLEAKDSHPVFGTAKQASVRPLVPVNTTSNILYNLADMACDIHNAMNKVASVYYDHKEADNMVKGMREEYTKACLMGKVAADGERSAMRTFAEPVGIIPSAVVGMAGGVPGAMRNIFENSLAMRDANRKSYDNNEVIDPRLMTEIRRVKITNALADAMADPILARYPVTDVFAAGKKLIDSNPEFERPANTNFLIDSIAQVLSQDGRIGTALHSSTAKTLHDIAGTRTNITGNTLFDVKNSITGTREAKETPGFGALFSDTLEKGVEAAQSGAAGVAKGMSSNMKATVKYLKDWEKRKLEKMKRKEEMRKIQKDIAKRRSPEGKHQEELKDRQERIKRLQSEVDAQIAEQELRDGTYGSRKLNESRKNLLRQTIQDPAKAQLALPHVTQAIAGMNPNDPNYQAMVNLRDQLQKTVDTDAQLRQLRLIP